MSFVRIGAVKAILHFEGINEFVVLLFIFLCRLGLSSVGEGLHFMPALLMGVA